MTGTMVGCMVRSRGRYCPSWHNVPGAVCAVVDEWWENGEGWYELEGVEGTFRSPDVFWEEVQRCSCGGRRGFDAATGESVECRVCDHGWVVVESPSVP